MSQPFTCVISLIFTGNAFSIIMTALAVFLLICVIICTIVFIYKMVTNNETAQMPQEQSVYFALLVMCGISCPIACICLIIRQSLLLHAYYPFPDVDYDSICGSSANNLQEIYSIVWIIFVFVGMMAYLFANGVYLQRLILILQNTIYEVSKKPKIVYIVYAIMTILTSLCIFVATYCQTFAQHSCGTILDKYSSQLQNGLILIGMTLYFSESVYICYLLISQMVNIMKDMKRSTQTQPRTQPQRQRQMQRQGRNPSLGETEQTGSIPNASIVCERSLPLFVKTRKLGILNFVTLITTVFAIIIIALFSYLINKPRIGIMIIQIACMFDVMIGLSCLAMQFTFGDKIYSKTLRWLETIWCFRSIESFVIQDFRKISTLQMSEQSF